MKTLPKSWHELVDRVQFDFPIKTTIAAEHAETDDIRLHVTYYVKNVEKPSEMIAVHTMEYVPPFERVSLGEALHIVRGIIVRGLEHEVDEWLCFDRKQITNPHANDFGVHL